jgi:hypothetical protein
VCRFCLLCGIRRSVIVCFINKLKILGELYCKYQSKNCNKMILTSAILGFLGVNGQVMFQK